MKTLLKICVVLSLLTPVLAGEGYKCDADAKTCSSKIAEKSANKGWLGVEMDFDEATSTLSVTKVVPYSPAQKAGFKAGDVFVAINDHKFSEGMDTVKTAFENSKIGDVVTYVLSSDGQERTVKAKLGRIPDDVVKTWVEHHIKQSHDGVAVN